MFIGVKWPLGGWHVGGHLTWKTGMLAGEAVNAQQPSAYIRRHADLSRESPTLGVLVSFEGMHGMVGEPAAGGGWYCPGNLD